MVKIKSFNNIHIIIFIMIGVFFILSAKIVYPQKFISSKNIKFYSSEIDSITNILINELSLNNNIILLSNESVNGKDNKDDELLSKGLKYIRNEKFTKAINTLKLIKYKTPAKFYYLGLTHFKCGSWREAISFLNKVVENPQYRNPARYFIYLAQLKLKDYRNAILTFENLEGHYKNSISSCQLDTKVDSLRILQTK